MPPGLERELVLVAEDDAANRALLAKPVRVKPLVDEVRRLLDQGAVARAS